MNLSRGAVAARAGCASWTLSDIERGKGCSVDLAMRLAAALEMTDADLAEVRVLVARAHTPPEVLAIIHLASNTPESYIRLGVGTLDDVFSLSQREFERLVQKALDTLPPSDRTA